MVGIDASRTSVIVEADGLFVNSEGESSRPNEGTRAERRAEESEDLRVLLLSLLIRLKLHALPLLCAGGGGSDAGDCCWVKVIGVLLYSVLCMTGDVDEAACVSGNACRRCKPFSSLWY